MDASPCEGSVTPLLPCSVSNRYNSTTPRAKATTYRSLAVQLCHDGFDPASGARLSLSDCEETFRSPQLTPLGIASPRGSNVRGWSSLYRIALDREKCYLVAQLSRKSYQKLFNTLLARKTSDVPCCRRTRGFALGSGTDAATFHVFSSGPASIVLALGFVAVPANQTESCLWPPGIKAVAYV